MNPHTIHNIKLAEVDEAAVTLTQAFKHDPEIRWILSSESDYQNKAPTFIAAIVRYCVLYGWAYRTENFEAIVLNRKPGDKAESLWRLWRSNFLKLPRQIGKDVVQRMNESDKLTSQAKQKHMGSTPFVNIWMIGVKPGIQGKGFGAALMQKTSAIAKELGSPICLETSLATSLAFHKKMAFNHSQSFTCQTAMLI